MAPAFWQGYSQSPLAGTSMMKKKVSGTNRSHTPLVLSPSLAFPPPGNTPCEIQRGARESPRRGQLLANSMRPKETKREAQRNPETPQANPVPPPSYFRSFLGTCLVPSAPLKVSWPDKNGCGISRIASELPLSLF